MAMATSPKIARLVRGETREVSEMLVRGCFTFQQAKQGTRQEYLKLTTSKSDPVATLQPNGCEISLSCDENHPYGSMIHLYTNESTRLGRRMALVTSASLAVKAVGFVFFEHLHGEIDANIVRIFRSSCLLQ